MKRRFNRYHVQTKAVENIVKYSRNYVSNYSFAYYFDKNSFIIYDADLTILDIEKSV